MLIDWFTVGAQVLNFLILVWLLKRFLYKPILRAIDTREKRIATELADADAKKAEAQKERDEFRQKNEEFDRQRAALLSKATEEATDERQRLLDEARQAADALSAKRQDTLRRDASNLNQAIVRRTQQEVFAIARKTLGDLAGASLEERMIDVFVQRVRELDDETKSSLGQALSSSPAVVRSAFDLPAGQRDVIQRAINETFSADPSAPLPPSPSGSGAASRAGPSAPLPPSPSGSGAASRAGPSAPLRAGIKLRFETAADVVSGIELSAAGQKVAWSIADYLASLEEGVDELLKGRTSDRSGRSPATAGR